MNDGDKLVAWLRDGAAEIENAHGALDMFGVRREHEDTACTLAARIAILAADLAQERDHFRRALIRIGNNESGHWGVIAREALKTAAATSQEGN